ncbi:FbpB family small basic protein [Alteribacillus sp. HJP-4]|uniref:FbpB family small basic protein n=1 Tax=Alteribacillus sp. HJP-4 TaxID=2775394 RepID=UPI0035CD3859
MRKPIRSTLEELINENKKELLNDPSAIEKIEEKLDDRKAKEVYVSDSQEKE